MTVPPPMRPLDGAARDSDLVFFCERDGVSNVLLPTDEVEPHAGTLR
jgi:hypothetical protein